MVGILLVWGSVHRDGLFHANNVLRDHPVH